MFLFQESIFWLSMCKKTSIIIKPKNRKAKFSEGPKWKPHPQCSSSKLLEITTDLRIHQLKKTKSCLAQYWTPRLMTSMKFAISLKFNYLLQNNYVFRTKNFNKQLLKNAMKLTLMIIIRVRNLWARNIIKVLMRRRGHIVASMRANRIPCPSFPSL